MHNDPMSLAPLRRGGRSLVALALASALILSGCSGDDEDPQEADGGSAASSSAAAEPYLPVPDGVELTAQGSDLALGDTATVAYEPRQDEVAALDLKVTAIEKASFKLFVGWTIKPEDKEKTPYFVHAAVKNVGETDLGGREIPLYAVDGENRLVEASIFRSTFKPCPNGVLPKKFGNGDAMKACLVYLAADKGEITAASFRPDEDFDPVVWTGEITDAKGLRPGGDKGKGEKDKKAKPNG